MFKKRLKNIQNKIKLPGLIMIITFAFITLTTIGYPILSQEIRISGEGTLLPICEVVSPDTSGANDPELPNNMIAIKWDCKNNVWVKANTNNLTDDSQWYNYSEKKWANAVVVTDTKRSYYLNASVGTIIPESDILAYYVWVPRYKYKLWNADDGVSSEQEIEIVFESDQEEPSYGGNEWSINRIYSNGENGEYLTHPSFTFGNNELAGFWVGKFETTGTIDSACTTETCGTANLSIKPNLTSIRNQSVSSMFYASRSMSMVNNNIYGFNYSQANTHMMKNTEWGAVAYLSHSKYGKNEEIVANLSTVTGGGEYTSATGQLQSTTGNIYGIYDMSGGNSEYVMGNVTNSTGEFYSNNAGFNITPASKYYDVYTYGATATDSKAYARGILGDATKETLKTFSGDTLAGWYSNNSNFPHTAHVWFIRGGHSIAPATVGGFSFNALTGSGSSSSSFRVVLNRGGPRAAPIITLDPNNIYDIYADERFVQDSALPVLLATARDEDNNIVTVTNNASQVVDVKVPGTYKVTFTATDSYGKTATKVQNFRVLTGTVVYFDPEANLKCTRAQYYANKNASDSENKSGCMKWYIFNEGDSSTSFNMILDHNTTISTRWSSSSSNATNGDVVNAQLQADIATWDTNVKSTARLITADEIAKIIGNTTFNSETSGEKASWFYLDTNSQTSPSTNNRIYGWLYDRIATSKSYFYGHFAPTNINDKYYWTSSKVSDSTSRAWYVSYYGNMGDGTTGAYGYVYYDKYTGLRPVITIPKNKL